MNGVYVELWVADLLRYAVIGCLVLSMFIMTIESAIFWRLPDRWWRLAQRVSVQVGSLYCVLKEYEVIGQPITFRLSLLAISLLLGFIGGFGMRTPGGPTAPEFWLRRGIDLDMLIEERTKRGST